MKSDRGSDEVIKWINTVLLNYNFTFASMDKCGPTQNFAWKQDKMWHLAWNLHNTRITMYGQSKQDSIRIVNPHENPQK